MHFWFTSVGIAGMSTLVCSPGLHIELWNAIMPLMAINIETHDYIVTIND
jgi:hypothetical protein